MRRRLTYSKIKTRPLILYCAINAISLWLKYLTYPGKGWKLVSVQHDLALIMKHQDGEIQYLIRIPPGWTADRHKTYADRLPVVYLQGLGFGLVSDSIVRRAWLKSSSIRRHLSSD